MHADMEETWRMLGIGTACSTCLVAKEDMHKLDAGATPRSIQRAIAAVREARTLNLIRGRKEEALLLLQSEGLHPFHLQQWNPFLVLPHAEFDCLDRKSVV